MRFLLIIAATVLIAQFGVAQEGGGGGRGQGRGGRGGFGRGPVEPPPPPKPGFECFESVATPEFPRAALMQHIDGTVWVTLDVTQQGMANNIKTEVSTAWANGEKLLTPPVEKVVREAKFKPMCYGKSVAVVYRYQLEGNAVANPKVTTETDPRILFINSPPELAQAAKKSGAAAR